MSGFQYKRRCPVAHEARLLGYEAEGGDPPSHRFFELRNIKHIPAEMRDEKRWLCWRAEAKEGGIGKVPISPHNGHKTSVTDPASWASLEDAILRYENDPALGGIGFALGGGWGGIDLDHVGGTKPHQWAADLVREIDCYAEISPSGDGIHVYFQGTIPPDLKNRRDFSDGSGIECYDWGRFFTVSGRPYGSHRGVDGSRVDAALHRLPGMVKSHDGERGRVELPPVPDPMDDATLNGLLAQHADLANTFAMQREDLGKDHSRYDAALFVWANRSGLSLGEAWSLVRAFRAFHGDEAKALRLDYIQMTVDKVWRAPGDAPSTAGGGYVRSITASAIVPRPIEWLWPNRVIVGCATLVSADAKVGKSMLMVDLAARVSAGLPWPCDEGTAPRGAVYMVNDEDLHDRVLQPRLREAGADLDLIHINQQSFSDAERKNPEAFDLEKHLGGLERAILDIPDCKLVILDPLQAITVKNVNAAHEARAALGPVQRLAERLNIAVVVVHHNRKDKNGSAQDSVSGSHQLKATVRGGLSLIRDKEDPERRLVFDSGGNYGRPKPPLAFRIVERAGAPPDIGYVEWEDEYPQTTWEEATAYESTHERRKRSEARDWLEDYLTTNGPTPVKELQVAARAENHSWGTIRLAQGDLGIKPQKHASVWKWELP